MSKELVAGAYIRVSTGLQVEGFSLDAQRRALSMHCAAQGWRYVEYAEEGESASKESASARPEFRRLLADVEARKVDVVLVHKLDRFSRNLVVTMQSLARIDQAGASFVSLSEHIDLTTPMGRLVLKIMASIAEWYSDNLATEVSKGRAERAAQGLWNGDLPFGYVSTGDPRVPPVQMPAEAALVREAFRRYASGTVSADEIAGWLNGQGARPRSKRGLTRFTKATVTDMLSNPFYVGRVRYRGEVFPGEQVPIVEEGLFEQVQRARVKRRKLSTAVKLHPSRVYMLRGLARCARCGILLVCTPNGSGRRYRDTSKQKHLDCPVKRASVDADELEARMGALMSRLRLPEGWLERARGFVSDAPDVRLAGARRRQLVDRLARLREVYLDGDLPRGRYETERAGLQAEVEAIDAQSAPVMGLEESGVMMERIALAWEELDEGQRAEAVGAVFEEVYVDLDAGEVVAVKERGPFAGLMGVLRTEGVLSGDPERHRVNPMTLWAPLVELIQSQHITPIAEVA